MTTIQAPATESTGQRLVDRLAKAERAYRETGHYKGIEELQLKKTDHFRYERVWAELRGALVSARETALHISASPIVRNIGELCFALYTVPRNISKYLTEPRTTRP